MGIDDDASEPESGDGTPDDEPESGDGTPESSDGEPDDGEPEEHGSTERELEPSDGDGERGDGESDAREPAFESTSTQPDRVAATLAWLRTVPSTSWIGLVLLLCIGALSIWLRWPGFTQGGFASHDVAGIVYEGQLIQSGGLPYVETLETKAPGTFFLSAYLIGGTDIASFQIWANSWAVVSLMAVAATAWRLWGPTTAVVAAALYGLHDAFLDTMDANYITWAQLPLVAGIGLALCAPQATTRRRQWIAWTTAGVLVGLSVLLKRPAVVSGAAIGLIALLPTPGDRIGRRGRILAVLAGGMASHVPLVLRYAVAGHLDALWAGYVLNDVGLRYVAEGSATGAGRDVNSLLELLMATLHYLALPVCLAMTAIAPPRDATSRRIYWGLCLWSAMSLAAASIGLRFYKGYFLHASAPLCLLAAAPWGLLGSRARLPKLMRLVLLVPALVLTMRQMVVLEKQRIDRARPHDRGGRIIARVIRKDLRRGDRIWVWGWHLWDVYPLTRTRSATRIYKAWGVITQSPDNNWRGGGTPQRFVDGPEAQMLVDELRQSRPVWIVLGSTVPRRDYVALQQLLRDEYVLKRPVRLGRVQFWHRRDRAEAMTAR